MRSRFATAGARRYALVAVTLTCATLAATAAAPAATTSAAWQTVAQVNHALKAKPLVIFACPPGMFCEILSSGVPSGIGYANRKVQVISATVHGLGASKRIARTPRYRKFEVRACAIDYQEGGAKVSAHFVWYTRAHTVDWNFRGRLGIKPIEQAGC